MNPAQSTPDSTCSFEFIFDNHFEHVARILTRIIEHPARAEELAVDVFYKLWRAHGVSADDAGAWLSRTAVRAGLDELRRQARQSKYEQFTSWLRPPRTPETLHGITEEQARVRTVLRILKPRDAELLLLRSDGCSYQEIAQALDLNPASVGTLVSRAQEAFKKEYVKRYGA